MPTPSTITRHTRRVADLLSSTNEWGSEEGGRHSEMYAVWFRLFANEVKNAPFPKCLIYLSVIAYSRDWLQR